MPKIRTTITPLEEVEVSEEEFTDLSRMGLILETQATTESGIEKAAIKQAAKNEEAKA